MFSHSWLLTQIDSAINRVSSVGQELKFCPPDTFFSSGANNSEWIIYQGNNNSPTPQGKHHVGGKDTKSTTPVADMPGLCESRS